ncbi:MAG: hypothetical protein ACK5WZ_05490, partial [Pseudobdellovibrionaceae bacterium]
PMMTQSPVSRSQAMLTNCLKRRELISVISILPVLQSTCDEADRVYPGSDPVALTELFDRKISAPEKPQGSAFSDPTKIQQVPPNFVRSVFLLADTVKVPA